jgi:PAS domain S-box-containing protein
MAINRDISGRIRDLLREHPEGLSITNIVRALPINRNTASRYLDTLLVSGQVEMRHFGMAKIYTLSRRLPVTSVLSISSEYVLQVDQYLRIIFMNVPFFDLLKFPEQDLIGRKIDSTPISAFFDEAYPLLFRWINEGLAGVERRGELVLAAQGYIFSCRVTPAVFSEGQKGVSVLLEDITSRKQDEMQLRESEEKFRSIVEASTDGILVCDEEGRIIEWNKALSGISGISREAVIGTSLEDIMNHTLIPERRHRHPMDHAISKVNFAIPARKSRLFFVPFEGVVMRPDGERRIIRQTLFPIETDRGIRIGSVIHDITERRIMEECLRESEEKFRTLFNNAADMITVHEIGPDGLPGTFIEVNDVGCRRLGYTRAEMCLMSPRDLIDPSCRQSMQENSQKLQRQGSAVFEMIHVTRSGERIPVEIRSHIFDFQGKRLALAQVRDLSKERYTTAALATSGARLRSIIRAAPVGIGLVVNRVIKEVNERLCEMTGYTEKELVDRSAAILYISDEEFDRAGTEKYQQIAKNRTGSIETRWRKKDGSVIDVLLSSTPLDPDNLSTGVTFTAMDISRQKRAEAEIRKQEQQYRFIVENSQDIINIQSPENICLYVSPSVTPVLGYTPPEVLKKPLLGLIHPEDLEQVRQNLVRIHTRGLVNVTSTFRFRHKKGHYLLFESKTTVIRDEKTGEIREFLSISRDITSRYGRHLREDNPGP